MRPLRPGPLTAGGLLARLAEDRRLWLFLLAGLVAALGILYARFAAGAGCDHDEVEHAHVAYRILNGQTPYRDFHQNHWPTYWVLNRQFVEAFPFSVRAILAGRAASLLALLAAWVLGFRLLFAMRGGKTRLACLLYTWAVIVAAYAVEFHEARPDPVMALLVTAGICLIPARGRVSGRRALFLGAIFGTALSVSTKMAPMLLIVPGLVFSHCLRERNPRIAFALVPYSLGVALGLLPALLWVFRNGLSENFHFDVFHLNLALSKPWLASFRFLQIPVYLSALLGSLAWLWAYRRPSNRSRNGPLVLALALAGGMVLAFLSRHSNLYNLQSVTVPAAVGFTALAAHLYLRMRGFGYRLLLVAALLGFTTIHVAPPMARLQNDKTIPQRDLQELMDLARPGDRTCMAFSPYHPVFCRDISALANRWDLYFADHVRDPRQLARFEALWRDGIDRTLNLLPDILLRDDPEHIWERAASAGLVSDQQLDALDRLRPAYEARRVGQCEVWVRRRG